VIAFKRLQIRSHIISSKASVGIIFWSDRSRVGENDLFEAKNHAPGILCSFGNSLSYLDRRPSMKPKTLRKNIRKIVFRTDIFDIYKIIFAWNFAS